MAGLALVLSVGPPGRRSRRHVASCARRSSTSNRRSRFRISLVRLESPAKTEVSRESGVRPSSRSSCRWVCRCASAGWFTVEAIFLPFDRDSTPELEFETNLVWLPGERTRGWVSSHVDVVDEFSSAERPTDRRAYTHKLNLELDTSVSIFNWLSEGRWLRGVEIEGSSTTS